MELENTAMIFQDKGRESLTWFSFQYWNKAGNRQNNVNVLNFREHFIFVLNFVHLCWSGQFCYVNIITIKI